MEASGTMTGEKDGSPKSKNDKNLRSCRGRKLVLEIDAWE